MSKGVLCSPRADRQTHRQTRKWIQRTPFQGFRNFSFNLSSRIGPIIEPTCIIKWYVYLHIVAVSFKISFFYEKLLYSFCIHCHIFHLLLWLCFLEIEYCFLEIESICICFSACEGLHLDLDRQLYKKILFCLSNTT